MKKIYLIALLMLLPLIGLAQGHVYKASKFGIRSNGIKDNTTSIQGAVDYIAAHGGGMLEFSVGRYLTGSVELKSGVSIRLLEGAIIVGSTNIYSYKGHHGIFWAEGQRNIIIDGNGVVDGRGSALKADAEEQKSLRHIPENQVLPSLLSFKDCEGIVVKDIILRNSASEPAVAVEGGVVETQGAKFE
jgi:polygalacturonase